MLQAIAPWERFPADPGEWTASQVQARARPWPGFLRVAGRDQAGRAFELELEDERELRKEWARRTGRRATATAPRIQRSPTDERRAFVRSLQPGLSVLVASAVAAVLAAGGSAAPLRALELDAELHADTVEAAVAEVRALTEPDAAVSASAPPLAPMPYLGDAERRTLQALRKEPRTTAALKNRGLPRRAREKLRTLGLIEQCGSGPKSARGVWRLTSPAGRTVLARIDAGE
ncbi:MAG: hypothetical protein INH34_14240 [Phycisphaerales bacterium]|nr:hypothetical protein [Phycisphaerales bacterium]